MLLKVKRCCILTIIKALKTMNKKMLIISWNNKCLNKKSLSSLKSKLMKMSQKVIKLTIITMNRRSMLIIKIIQIIFNKTTIQMMVKTQLCTLKINKPIIIKNLICLLLTLKYTLGVKIHMDNLALNYAKK